MDKTVNLNQEINVTVRLMPAGDEVVLELPLGTFGKEIKETLLHSDLNIPIHDPEGNKYTYKLTCKESGKEVADALTLYDAGVSNNYTLLFMPMLVAGK